MASHYESQAASTRNRGFRPLCEPAGGVWRWWRWRRLWRRRRSDYDSYNRHNYDRHNYDKYVRYDNYDNVGRSQEPSSTRLRAIGAPAQAWIAEVN